MRIDSSLVGMESERTYESVSTRRLSFRVSLGGAGSQAAVGGGMGTEESMEGLAEGSEGRTDIGSLQESMGGAGRLWEIPSLDTGTEAIEEFRNIREQCLLYLWRILFGEEEGRALAERLGLNWGKGGSTAYGESPQDISWSALQLTAQEEYTYRETENTSFSATGVVRTADGREISFNLDVEMSRSFASYTSRSLEVAVMCDPLVINLNGNVAEVSGQKFYFDLDADGEEEAIARLCEDSGYLALDLNGDGVINNGSELFGTQSGDGFADLAEYDGDGNGWIDENDEIWSRLQIWVQKEDGSFQLYRLEEKGVGALCLQNVSTDFTQKDSGGEVSAAVRSTGIFLYENGLAGTLQHLDLALEQQA